jgi:hypothetical protein
MPGYLPNSSDRLLVWLLGFRSQKSRDAAAVRARRTVEGCRVSIVTVPYEFQQGGNQMMTVHAGRLSHYL